MGKWDDLSIAEKSEMMKVAIANGITNLNDIKAQYNEFAGGGDIKYYQPYYDYSLPGHPLTRNADIPEVVIRPDSALSPEERAIRERARRANHDRAYGTGTYNAVRDREQTEAQVAKVNNIYKNSTEGKVLNAAQKAASGVKSVAEFTPVAGDVIQGLQSAKDAAQGNYAEAGIGAGLLLAPNFIEKPLKYVGKGLKNSFRNMKKNYKRLNSEIDWRYRDEFGESYLSAIGRRNEKIAHDYGTYFAPPSDAEKAAFNKRYKNWLEDRSSAGNIEADVSNGGFSRFGYSKENEDRVLDLFRHNPEYYTYVNEQGVADPLSQNAVNGFIDRQLTSIRGVHAPDKKTAEQYLTTTQRGRYMKGGDRLDTEGGLYTSNNATISDRFKNPVGGGKENGYVAVLKEPDTINRELPIEEQLKQLRGRTEFGGTDEVLAGTEYLPNLDTSNAKMYEALYVGGANRGTGGYERAYMPQGQYGEMQSPVQISSLTEYLDQVDQNGRWGYKLNADTNPNLFIAKQLNAYDDYVKRARAVLQPTKRYDYNKINAKFKELEQIAEDRAAKRREILDRFSQKQTTYKVAKEQLPWWAGMASFMGGTFGTALYMRDKDEKGPRMREYKKLGKIGNVLADTTEENKKALGGNLYSGGGSTTDDDLIDWIIREEGFNKKPENIGDGKITLGSGLTDPKWHELYKKRGNVWSAADNRAAVAEEVANRRRWAESDIPNWDSLPVSAQKALLSYKYNYNFNRANSPKLYQALEDSNLYEAAKQMDATSKDPKFKEGLQKRRQREQNWFLEDVKSTVPKVDYSNHEIEIPVSTRTNNPYITQAEATKVLPTQVPATNSYIRTITVSPQQQKRNSLRKAFDAAVNFNKLMKAVNIMDNLPVFVPKANGGKLFGNGGHVYEVLPQMLKDAGLNVRVTSGYRKAGQAGKAGSKSWHTRHGAVDIVPQGKTTFSDIENALYNNPTIANYMLSNGFGLIDESGRSEESKATMRKTGATGAHFHIGKDSKYAKMYANRMTGKGKEMIVPQQPTEPVVLQDEYAFMPSNPQAFFAPLESYQQPIELPEVEQPILEAANAYSKEELEKEQKREGLKTLSWLLGMTSPNGNNDSFINTLGMLTGFNG